MRRVSLITMGLLFYSPALLAESAEQLKINEQATREQMLSISKQLGVTCTECHFPSNFKDSTKKSYKISLEHMKITHLLQENGFDGKRGPEVSCFMCHQGKLTPTYKQK